MNDELKDSITKLKRYVDFINRRRFIGAKNNEISDDFKQYFYDFTDDGWKLHIYLSSFYIEIYLKKILKREDAEKEFYNIVDRMNEIKGRLSDEYFNSNFLIFFIGLGQQDTNPETMRSDLYSYKGIGKDLLPDDDKYSNSEYFLAKIQYALI